MKIKVKKDGWKKIEFFDFEKEDDLSNELIDVLQKTKEEFPRCDITLEQLEESYQDWLDDIKSNIHTPGGWNIYHPCRHNHLRFEIDYDPTQKSYKY